MSRRWCSPCEKQRNAPMMVDPGDYCFACSGPSEKDLQGRNKLSDADVERIAEAIVRKIKNSEKEEEYQAYLRLNNGG